MARSGKLTGSGLASVGRSVQHSGLGEGPLPLIALIACAAMNARYRDDAGYGELQWQVAVVPDEIALMESSVRGFDRYLVGQPLAEN